MADLCLDNNIHDPQLWNSVLQQLLAFGMVSECVAEIGLEWLAKMIDWLTDGLTRLTNGRTISLNH